MKKIYKNFVFDIIAAVVALALGIVMLPPFGIGQQLLNILLAVTLVAYLVIYLYDKLRRNKGITFVLSLVEFIVISLVAIGLVFQQFSHIEISGVCSTIGIVLWLRGMVSALGMYITASSLKKSKRTLTEFVIALFVISVGAYFFAHPIVSDLVLTWIIDIVFFLQLSYSRVSPIFSPLSKRKLFPKRQRATNNNRFLQHKY